MIDKKEDKGLDSFFDIWYSLRIDALSIFNEKDIHFYISLLGTDDLTDEFSSSKLQIQFCAQEIMGLAEYLAENVPAENLSELTIFDWHRDSIENLMNLTAAIREGLYGIDTSFSLIFSKEDYEASVKLLEETKSKNNFFDLDTALGKLLKDMHNASSFKDGCYYSLKVCEHLQKSYPFYIDQSCCNLIEVIMYNGAKCKFDDKKQTIDVRISIISGYDMYRSITSLLSLLLRTPAISTD